MDKQKVAVYWMEYYLQNLKMKSDTCYNVADIMLSEKASFMIPFMWNDQKKKISIR